MSNEIDVEIVETKDVVVLVQKPIIEYDLIEAKGKEVAERIASLNLDSIEPTEDNLRLLKTTRTELGKEFKDLEDKRKMIKDKVMKPYNDFNDAYTKHIATLFKSADAQLKEKVSVVDDAVLNIKIDGIKSHFNDVNKYDFVKFEDLNLKIIKSISDKKIKEEIDSYLSEVAQNLETIETLDNKERILAKFQMSKNLNDAISQTQMEIKREKEIKEANKKREEERIERERLAKEAEERQKEEDFANAQAVGKEVVSNVGDIESQHEAVEPKKEEPQVVSAKFKATGTLDDIKRLKQFCQDNGIKLESLKEK